MTSRRQISLFTEDELTLLPEGSHASPTARQAKDWGKMTSDISGPICLDAFGRFPRVGSWARMFSALLIGQAGWSSTKCRLIWKLKGTRFNRMYFQLQASTLPTEEIGSGLLLTPTSVMTDEPPEKMRERAERNGYKNGTQYGSLLSQVKYSAMLPTPTAGEHKHGKTDKYWQNRIEKGRQEDLSMQAYKGMLPTPTTDSATNRKENYKQGGTPLSVAVNKMLPTPATRDANNAEYPDKYAKRKEYQKSKGVNLEYPLRQFAMDCNPTGKTSQLNPLFVEEMMGFPENWTILPFQSGETNQSKPTGTP